LCTGADALHDVDILKDVAAPYFTETPEVFFSTFQLPTCALARLGIPGEGDHVAIVN
jgi:hypothetical protein